MNICGAEYAVELVDEIVGPVESSTYGTIMWDERKIVVRTAGRSEFEVLTSLIHEIIHGVVAHSSVTELIDARGDHDEVAIQKLAAGIAGALCGKDARTLRSS